MLTKIQTFISNPFVGKVLTFTVGVILIWLLIKILQKNVFSKISGIDSRYRAKKLSSFIGYFLTVVLITVVFKDKLSELTVALGIAGAGIAIALQEVIISFAGWLAILFGGFFKPGDRIQMGSTKGDVMDIGILRTTIMEIGQWVDGDLYNGRIVSIANSYVFKDPVFNYSGDFPFLWDEIKIPIQYGSNYDKTKEILLNIGKTVAGEFSDKSREDWQSLERKYRLEDTPTEPIVSLVVTDNWVSFTLRYIVVYKMRRITKTELYTRILNEIEATKGEIKIASAILNSIIGSVNVEKN